LPGSELLAVLLVSGLPDRLVSVLKATKVRQAAERLALGCGAFDYVVSNEAGEPYSPAVLSRYWRDAREGRWGAPHQVSRGPAHVRHPDAPVWGAGGPSSRRGSGTRTPA
jgi:hypothetical protein